ncbi:MAG: NUDIX domain-containing protein [Thermoanaerobaculia bacterium]
MKKEDVMVVATAELAPFLASRKADLIREATSEILRLIATRHTFIPRERAEVSPEYRQIIPYVLIRHGNAFFVLERTPKQSEARLHHKVSLGIGGHINPGDDLAAGLRKELEEEVAVESPYTLQFIGILNDETTEVGRVHLGAVHLLTPEAPRVSVRETEKMSGRWVAVGDLPDLRPRMETWSQIVLDQYLR